MQKYTQHFYVFLFISIFVVYWVSNCHIVSGSGTSILEFGCSLDLQKKKQPSRWFCMQFPYPSVSHRGSPGETKQKFLQFLLCILWTQRCGGAQLKGMFLKLTELKGLTKGLKKKGVSWVNLSLLIYYWWIEVASDGFLAWCDVMPRAEYFGRTRRHFWSPNRKQEPCVVINSEWIFVGSSVHRGVVNEISKGRIFSYCVSTSMLHISLGL